MAYKATILVVDDVLESRRFYETVFSMVVEEDHGIYNVGFSGGLALYRRELFRQISGLTAAAGKSETSVAYFEFADVPLIESRCAGFPGAEIVHPTTEQPWGQLAFRARDPDGHLLEIGEDMSVCVRRLLAGGMTVEEAARKTGYTPEKTAALAGKTVGD